ncbi:MAG: hypothetical protein CM1200mP40_35450 [Gammaproteobacteria bacterium]|nr:MAG: hypothetical protein CM1200mP40_35450 [Gammaproteobacteria bacterium]
MQRAIDESNRRRNTQLDYNKEHNITPIGVKKKVLDVMEGPLCHARHTRSTETSALAKSTGAYSKFDFSDPSQVKKGD